jgi:hypothetical protein
MGVLIQPALTPTRNHNLNISTSLFCRYVRERDTHSLGSGDQGIVCRVRFVVQALHYAL